MRRNIISVVPSKRHQLTTKRDSKPLHITLYSDTNLLVSKLTELWSNITASMNNERNSESAKTTLLHLQALYDHVDKLTPLYVAHPSLTLGCNIFSELNMHHRTYLASLSQQELEEQCNKYMTVLTMQLTSASHAAACANFDRLFRRKQESLRAWLTHHLLSNQRIILDVILYPPFSNTYDTQLPDLTTAFKRWMHAKGKQSVALRSFDGYVWQLQYDNGIGFYYHLLLAISPDSNIEGLQEQLNRQWEATWHSTASNQKIPSLSMPTKRDNASLSESDIQAQIHKITETFCALDSIIKLRVPQGAKTYHHTNIPFT